MSTLRTRSITPDEERNLNLLKDFCSKRFKNSDYDRSLGTSKEGAYRNESEVWHKVLQDR